MTFFLKNLLFTYFLERGREGEGDGEKHECVVAFHAPCPPHHWGPGLQSRHVP